MGATDEWLTNLREKNAAKLGTALSYDKVKPEQAAEAEHVGKALGVPSAVVSSQPDVFKRQLDQKKFTESLKGAPATASWLRDMQNGALAKDDLDNLTWFERELKPFASTGSADGPFGVVSGVGRAIGRGARRTTAIPYEGGARVDAQTVGDFGKTQDEIYQSIIGEWDNPSPETLATARQTAQLRFETVEGLTDAQRADVLSQGADDLAKSREILDKAASVAMSEGAAQFRDTTLANAENTVTGALSAFAADPVGGAAFLVETAAEFLPMMAAATGVTIATRSPGLGAVAMGVGSGLTENTTGAMEFLAENGVDLSTPDAALAVLENAELMQAAADRGLTRGLIIGLMDAASGGVAGQTLMQSPAGEMVAQGLAQVIFGAGGEGMAQAASGQEIDWRDIVIEGLAELVTAPVEVLGVGGRGVLRKLEKGANETALPETLDKIDGMAAASKLKQRSPDKFAEAVGRQELGEVYVPADKLREFFQAKDMTGEEWGFDPEYLGEQALAGAHVPLPLSTYASTISGTDSADWVRNNAVFDPDEMSASEAAEFNAQVQDILQEAREEVAAAVEEDRAIRSADVQIYDSVFSQLRAAGRSPDVAGHEARVMAAFWRTMGERYGEDPLDLAKSMGLRIQGPQTPELARRRGDLDIRLNALRADAAKALKPYGGSLVDFVIGEGGIQDVGGDVASFEPPKGVVAETREEIMDRRSQPTIGAMPALGKGIGLDEMARLANEAGYLDTEDTNDLLAAIGASLAGEPVYRIGEGVDPAMEALAEELSRRAIDLTEMTNDEVAAALEESDGREFEQFAGPQSETADFHSLARAKDLIEGGANAEQVRRETGWFRGVDGKWRYEISDDKAVLSDAFIQAEDGAEFALGDVLEHERLYAAYPDLKLIPVIVDNSIDALGQISGTGTEMRINLEVGKDRGVDDIRSTVLHEIQHLIQRREGFGFGGNLNMSPRIKRALKALADRRARYVQDLSGAADMGAAMSEAKQASHMASSVQVFQDFERLIGYSKMDRPSGVFRHIRNATGWLHSDLIRKSGDYELSRRGAEMYRRLYELPKRGAKRNAFLRDYAFDLAQLLREAVPDETWAAIENDPRQLKSILNAMEREARKAREKLKPLDDARSASAAARRQFSSSEFLSPFEVYQLLAGEVEARNTQNRADMTDAERKDTPPRDTQTKAGRHGGEEPVRDDQIIVLFPDGEIETPMIANSAAPSRTFFQTAPATDSAAFRNWFGDSKVVDENGAPLPVYLSNAVRSVLSGESPIAESGKDGLRGNAELLSHLLVGPAFRTEGLSGFEAPVQRVVLRSVLSFGEQRDVLGSVVELIPVDVVDMLADQGISPERLFSDEAVLQDLLSADADDAIADVVDERAISRRVADALVDAITTVTAKWPLPAGLVPVGVSAAPAESAATVGARVGYLAVSTHDANILEFQELSSPFNRGTFDAGDPRILYQSKDGPVSLDALPVERLDQAVALQSHMDSSGLGPKQLSDIFEGVSLVSESDRLGSIPSLAPMFAHMRTAAAEQSEILDAVVGGVSVDMVNNLFGSEAAAKVALHDEAMLKDSPAFNADLSVSSGFGDTTRAVRLLIVQEAINVAEVARVFFSSGRESLEGTPAKIASQGKAFRQGDNSTKRASIVFPSGGLTSGQTVINLFENSDLSSFLHESSHFFLEAFSTLADAPNAPEAMRKDMATIREWLGNDGGPFTTEQHEKWARGGEAYFMEGKAPSLDLADAFARFKSWLTRIYRSIKGLNVKITPEIREVMDRMLATDAEIAEARAEMEMRPLFKEAPAGMSKVDFQTYQRMAQRSADQAEQRLIDKTMAKVRRERETWYRDEKKAVRKEVEASVNKQREYRLTEALSNRRWFDADGETTEMPDMRMDRQGLIDLFGEGVLKEIDKSRFGGKYAIYKKDGDDPRSVAEFFGFKSASEMLDVLQNTPKRKDAIDAEVERVMTERHGDPLNDGTIEEEALRAIHNDQQANTVVAEVRHLAGQIGRKTTNLSARIYRHRARAMLGRMTVKDAAKPHVFLSAERRAADNAQRAFAKVARGGGEAALAEAYQAKEQQLLNHMLYNEAKDFEAKLQRGREKMRSYSKKSVREKLAGGYIEQIDDLLERFDFRKRSPGQVERTESLQEYITRMEADGREAELAIDQRLLDEAKRTHYTRLTVEEFNGLTDTIANIDHMGRFKQNLIERNRKRKLAESASNVEGAIRKSQKASDRRDSSRGMQALNLIRRPDTIMIDLDGGKEMGPVYDELKRGIDEGQAEEQKAQVKMAEDFDALFNGHYSRKELRAMVESKAIPGVNAREWSKQEILSLALNMGAEENHQRVLDRNVDPEMLIDPETLHKLLSTLDENDWRFVQGMWDMVNSYWPDLAAVHKRRTGVEPDKVQAKLMYDGAPDFVRGGYYPIKYDATRGASAAKDEQSAWDKFLTAGHGSTAAVKNGMTKQRQKTGGGRTIKYDLNVPFQHLRETVRYIALSEAVDNAYRILQHEDVVRAFQDTGNADTLKTLNLWVKDTAQGPIFNTDLLNSTARLVKNNFTLSKLAFNLKTVILQATGIGQSAATIGKMNMARGYLAYMKRPHLMIADVTQKSALMAERQTTFQKDIFDFINDVKVQSPLAGKWSRAKKVTAQVGFWPMIKMQFLVVDMPTWIGAYDAGLRKYKGDDAKAVHYADRMVVRAQDSGLFADRAAVERGTVSENVRQADFIRLFTTLGGYMLTKLNRMNVTAKQAVLGVSEADTAAKKTAAAFSGAVDMMLLLMFEPMLMALIYSLASDDDEPEDVAKFIAVEMGMATVGGIPVVRDMANAARGYGGGGVYGSVLEMPYRAGVQAMQGEMDSAFVKAMGDVFGVATGLPTTAFTRAVSPIFDEDASTAEVLMGRNPLAD